ncbi:unnamed protein product [Effrenium voratum]|uniref:Uncharacterized protein n=1 Tax=Effrenium voratum TaxID=2562239 RepID=A0AA36HL86_9DINO|nr:unnamed protein product [Effrenium voratum]
MQQRDWARSCLPRKPVIGVLPWQPCDWCPYSQIKMSRGTLLKVTQAWSGNQACCADAQLADIITGDDFPKPCEPRGVVGSRAQIVSFSVASMVAGAAHALGKALC